MLDLAQAETGTLPLYPTTIATHDFLTRVFTDARRIAAPADAVSWRLQLPQELPSLSADPVRVRNALLNILDSAGKSTARGQIVMSAQASATHLLITIQDTGRGIDPSRLARIRHGVTGDAAAPADEADLSDLGWRIAQHIVALHGGEFTVSSEPGRGVACQIALPLTPAGAVDKRGAAWATGVSGSQDIAAAQPQQFVGHGDLALVQKVHEFIAAQYVTPFTRGDLARVLGVSEAYVSRVFRRVTGCPLWEYVNHYRNCWNGRRCL
jgi:anti-sigma regulatory factor (Ser/Thr protein kinase)